jgi:hypothetical protein
MKTKQREEDDFGFWTKYKRFAGNEILLYAVMVIGVLLGILLFG